MESVEMGPFEVGSEGRRAELLKSPTLMWGPGDYARKN